MRNAQTDTHLETELQELYMLARHWSADLDYLDEELQFFKNVLVKYPEDSNASQVGQQENPLGIKVSDLERHLAGLRARLPDFLGLLAPYISDLNKPMDLTFLEKYNTLKDELQALFSAVRMTKKELFAHTETLMLKA